MTKIRVSPSLTSGGTGSRLPQTGCRDRCPGSRYAVALAVIACSVRTVVAMSSTSNWLSKSHRRGR